MADPIVLDSWAVMAYLQDEPSARSIGKMLADANEHGVPLLMCVVNVGEVWYTIALRRSARDADATIGWIKEIGVSFIDADWAMTQIAARYKAKGGIAYADCFAAALAKTRGATLVTGDPEFKQVEKDVSIKWLN